MITDVRICSDPDTIHAELTTRGYLILETTVDGYTAMCGHQMPGEPRCSETATHAALLAIRHGDGMRLHDDRFPTCTSHLADAVEYADVLTRGRNAAGTFQVFPATARAVKSARVFRVADPSRRHVFFYAIAEAAADQFRSAMVRDGAMSIERYEFADSGIRDQVDLWVDAESRDGGKPLLLLVGSLENGQWIHWNLTAEARPAVEAL